MGGDLTLSPLQGWSAKLFLFSLCFSAFHVDMLRMCGPLRFQVRHLRKRLPQLLLIGFALRKMRMFYSEYVVIPFGAIILLLPLVTLI